METNEEPEKEKVPKQYETEYPVISTLNEIDFSGSYSYAHYLRWEIKERLELIKGKVFEMGAPSTKHQRYTGFIFAELYHFLKNKKCEAFISPFDVRFPNGSKNDQAIYTVLQPDICVVCDPSKLDEKGCIGAPDIVVEILSPGNNRKELDNKFNVYQEYGVKEYWIVHPAERSFLKYVRNEAGVFQAGRPYSGGADFISDVLPGFSLNIEEVFGNREYNTLD